MARDFNASMDTTLAKHLHARRSPGDPYLIVIWFEAQRMNIKTINTSANYHLSIKKYFYKRAVEYKAGIVRAF